MREEFGTPIVDWEILHGGVGGDVEQGARTSKHIVVFAFAPLVSLTLSHFIFVHSIILIVIAYYIHCLCCLASISYCYILDCLA